MTETKNSLDRLYSKIEITEDEFNEFEDRSI